MSHRASCHSLPPPGFPEAYFSWWRQLEAFRDTHDCVAIDPRGYNLSSRPPGRHAYRMDRLVGDIAAALRILSPGGAPVAVAGHDWGGVLAWHVAILHPELVSRLTVLCAPHPACFMQNFDWDQFKR